MAKIKASDIISKNDFIMYSRYRMGTVVAIPRKEIDGSRMETEKEYRERCKLDSRAIGIALTSALPSEFIMADITDNHATTAQGDIIN